MTDRSRGALLGLAVDDARGMMLEFGRPGTAAPTTDGVGGGSFGLQPGQGTDDTSLLHEISSGPRRPPRGGDATSPILPNLRSLPQSENT